LGDQVTRVLVADDSETVLLMLERRLEMSGYEVITARDGEQVLDVLEQHADGALPDVILLDAMMPKLSGVDALKQLRADGHEMPVLMISAHLDAQQPDKMQEIGANGVVPKPFEWEVLIERIEELAGP
jgi:DNA-binding response OmpR family regulator